jgi:hypothetical protein
MHSKPLVVEHFSLTTFEWLAASHSNVVRHLSMGQMKSLNRFNNIKDINKKIKWYSLVSRDIFRAGTQDHKSNLQV